MNDPQRLLHGGSSDLERELLMSALDDAPPSGARQRTLAALGLGAAVASAGMSASAAAASSPSGPLAHAAIGSTAASAPGVGAGVAAGVGTASVGLTATAALLQGVGAGILVGALALAGVTRGFSGPSHAEARSEAQPEGARTTSVATGPDSPPIRHGASALVGEAPRPPQPLAVPSDPAALTGASARPADRDRGPAPSADPRTLSAEVALLDEAREALAKGDANGTLQRLDQFDRRFAPALLEPEAQVLRVEALMRRGSTEDARRQGAAFLAAHPESPHAARVRSLIGSTGP